MGEITTAQEIRNSCRTLAKKSKGRRELRELKPV
jgi:hypothetical protein